MKIYEIETNSPDYYGDMRYRFVSLYNGTRGTWFHETKKAEQQGERHQQIIEKFHMPIFTMTPNETRNKIGPYKE